MADLIERLASVKRRIGDMCAEMRPPKMRIPVTPDDDDVFITETADLCAAALRAKDEEIARLRQRAVDFFVNDGDESMAHAVLHGDDWLGSVLEYAENMAALAVSASADANRAITRARKAESDLDSATQPLAPEMARLNANLIAANEARIAAEQALHDARVQLQRYHAAELPGGWTEVLQVEVNARHAAEQRAERAEQEAAKLKTVMIAAAEEIHEHWDAHCNAEGYGPTNLMRRLEEGIPSEYGYTAGAFAQLKQRAEAAEERIRALEKLREVVEPMMAALGYHGQMSARGDLVSKVMDALAAIDAEAKP